MEITKRIHQGWKEFNSLSEEAKKNLPISLGMFGKYQYICKSKKGEISLIHIRTSIRPSPRVWEILCMVGNLFEDVERFPTKKEAMKRIKELLEQPKAKRQSMKEVEIKCKGCNSKGTISLTKTSIKNHPKIYQPCKKCGRYKTWELIGETNDDHK